MQSLHHSRQQADSRVQKFHTVQTDQQMEGQPVTHSRPSPCSPAIQPVENGKLLWSWSSQSPSQLSRQPGNAKRTGIDVSHRACAPPPPPPPRAERHARLRDACAPPAAPRGTGRSSHACAAAAPRPRSASARATTPHPKTASALPPKPAHVAPHRQQRHRTAPPRPKPGAPAPPSGPRGSSP